MLPVIKDDPVNKTLANVHFSLYFMNTTFLLCSAIPSSKTQRQQRYFLSNRPSTIILKKHNKILSLTFLAWLIYFTRFDIFLPAGIMNLGKGIVYLCRPIIMTDLQS